jgi:polynucleotide 5'-hydroxyl-kinase GRC3/NOL9
MDIVPNLEWERLLEKLIKDKGTVLLLGATDSGKSTLAKYFIKRLVSENIRVSLVDSDVGQSSL